MKEYEHWDMESMGTIFVSVSVSALNVIIFIVYEAVCMTALDKAVEIMRNIQMRKALQSGYFVVDAPTSVWFGKRLQTRSIKRGDDERMEPWGWINSVFKHYGLAYFFLYAVPAGLLIYAQLKIDSVKTQAITGNETGHLLNVDVEHLVQTNIPDRKLTELRESVDCARRTVIDSRIVHYGVYEVQGKPKEGKQCKPGSIAINSTNFEVRYPADKEVMPYESDLESTMRRSIQSGNVGDGGEATLKTFGSRHCNSTIGDICLAYQTNGTDLDVVIGRLTEDMKSFKTTKEHSDRFARILLDRNWKKAEAENLIKLIHPIVNEHYDDDPVFVIDAIWLLSLRKKPSGKNKVVPEKCELTITTIMTMPSIIIFSVILGLTVIFWLNIMIMWLYKYFTGRNDHTVLNESGTTKGLLWSYANELEEDPTGFNKAPEESPKISLNTGSEEYNHVRSKQVEVRPVRRNNNDLENS